MIVFYKREVDDVILTSIIKHYNPSTATREYADNKEVLKTAKIMNTYNFIRVKDYKQAVLNKYHYPKWINNTHRTNYLKTLLCHKDTNTDSLIEFIAKNLFKPENIFEAYTEEVLTMKERAGQVQKEINLFKTKSEKKIKKGIIYMNINPEHDIGKIISEDLAEDCTLPVIILQHNTAHISNAEQLGFKKKNVKTSRYEALKMKKDIIIQKPISQKINMTRNTTLLQY